MSAEILRAGVGCPWHNSRLNYGAPNLKWCEESLCRWIEEPANTWSNLSYIFAGIYILLKGRQTKSTPIILLGWSAILMGAGSFAYHAINNYPLQIVDFAGMYFYTSAIILFNLIRLGWVSKNNSTITYLILIVINFLLIPLFQSVLHIHIQLIIAVNLVTMLVLEYKMRQKDSTYSMKDLYLCLGLFAIAETFSLLDVSRIWCDPSRHIIQGHALWHWLGGIAVYYSYRHYRQFKNL